MGPRMTPETKFGVSDHETSKRRESLPNIGPIDKSQQSVNLTLFLLSYFTI